MITILLITIIAVAEVLRLILTHKGTSKKGHFRQKLDAVSKMIYDLEFKVFKTKEIREDVRKEYDMMNSRIASLDSQIYNFPKDKDQADKKRIEDDKVLAERDLVRFKAQMVALDKEIFGEKPSTENPDGATGINDQIDSLRELQTMLKSWIKTL